MENTVIGRHQELNSGSDLGLIANSREKATVLTQRSVPQEVSFIPFGMSQSESST